MEYLFLAIVGGIIGKCIGKAISLSEEKQGCFVLYNKSEASAHKTRTTIKTMKIVCVIGMFFIVGIVGIDALYLMGTITFDVPFKYAVSLPFILMFCMVYISSKENDMIQINNWNRFVQKYGLEKAKENVGQWIKIEDI